MRSVLLYSGGLDSRVLLAKLLDQGHEVSCLTLNYGQRHARELEFASKVMCKLGLSYQQIDLSNIQALISNSALTGSAPVPDGHYTEEKMKVTVVPNRNMIMLSLAIGWAINQKANAVAYAAHSGDHSIYPDCRPEFIAKMAEAAALCDWHPVQILTPFAQLSKTEIVLEGHRLGVDFSETWSCYKGGEFHCGRCATCVERQEAFQNAGLIDPTIYEQRAA